MWTGNQQMTNQGLPEIPNTPLGVKEEGQYYFQEWRQSSRNVGGISNHIIMLKSTKLSFVLASFMLINSLRFSQGVTRESSGSHKGVISQSLGSHQGVIRKPSRSNQESHQGVIRESTGSHQGVIGESLGSHHICEYLEY